MGLAAWGVARVWQWHAWDGPRQVAGVRIPEDCPCFVLLRAPCTGRAADDSGADCGAIHARSGRPPRSTDTDMQRLRQAMADADAEVERVKTRDAATSSRLARELDDLRDEVAYLRVKLRKEGHVSRAEYFDSARPHRRSARPRRRRRRPRRPSATASAANARFRSAPSSTCGWSTASARGATRWRTGSSRRPWSICSLGERVVIPAGSEMRGIVSSVDKAGRVDRKAGLTLAFDRITIDGREREIRGSSPTPSRARA